MTCKFIESKNLTGAKKDAWVGVGRKESWLPSAGWVGWIKFSGETMPLCAEPGKFMMSFRNNCCGKFHFVFPITHTMKQFLCLRSP